jgi:hypothetical protein
VGGAAVSKRVGEDGGGVPGLMQSRDGLQKNVNVGEEGGGGGGEGRGGEGRGGSREKKREELRHWGKAAHCGQQRLAGSKTIRCILGK